jgi:hypothetical protein
MGSSAFEIVLIPVLRGMVYGIIMGMVMLALMRGLDLLAGSTQAGRIWNGAGKSCPVRFRSVMEPGEAAHRSRSGCGHAPGAAERCTHRRDQKFEDDALMQSVARTEESAFRVQTSENASSQEHLQCA